MAANARTEDAAWLRSEILKLAKEADSNAAEDEERAENGEGERYGLASEAAAHYANQLRRILKGLTWDEDFVERARASGQRRSRGGR